MQKLFLEDYKRFGSETPFGHYIRANNPLSYIEANEFLEEEWDVVLDWWYSYTIWKKRIHIDHEFEQRPKAQRFDNGEAHSEHEVEEKDI